MSDFEWLKEQGADLRARTQAEYLYTAAALAFYGGVCWGIGALPKSGWLAAIGVFIVAGLVSWKVYADHRTYRKIWLARGIIIRRLEPSDLPPHSSLFPEPNDNRRKWRWVEWCERKIDALSHICDPFLVTDASEGLRGEPGPGYLISIAIVLAGVFAALFCFSVWAFPGSSCTHYYQGS